MKIGVISDTHGHLDLRILEHFQHCDEIWHCGDIGNLEVAEVLAKLKPLRAVFGNIDTQDIVQTYPLNQKFVIQGWKIWITHIGGRPPYYNPKVLAEFTKDKPDIFLCGHSHILSVQKDWTNQLWYINPGAAGHHGIHKIRTILRFDLQPKKITNLEVIELGPR